MGGGVRAGLGVGGTGFGDGARPGKGVLERRTRRITSPARGVNLGLKVWSRRYQRPYLTYIWVGNPKLLSSITKVSVHK